VIRVFFRQFIEFGATFLYDKFVSSYLFGEDKTDEELLDTASSLSHEFKIAGYPGCIGSMDATHMACEKVPNNIRQSHLSFKLPYTARTYNLTCNHRRRIISCTEGHPARWNDKTLQNFDRLAVGLQRGTSPLCNLPFELYEYDSSGNVTTRKYRGAWLIVDNGYLSWATNIPPIKSTTRRMEIRWSEWLEPIRKDVEDTEGGCLFARCARSRQDLENVLRAPQLVAGA